MLHIHRNKRLIILLLGILSQGISQKKKIINDRIFLQDYDNKLVHFGYYIGPHVAKYKIKYNQQFNVTSGNFANPAVLITSPDAPALWRFGGTVNYYIDDNFDFKTGLGASIFDRKIKAYFLDKDPVTGKTFKEDKDGNTAWVEIPLYLKYKSERRRNNRMYMVGGFRYAAEIGAIAKRGGKQINVAAKKKQDFCVEYGVGLENFTPYAKITPELCFSHGLVNLLSPSSNKNQIGISKINSNSITLFFYFE